MSQLVARILLTLFLLPFGLIVFFIAMLVLESNHSSPNSENQHMMIAGAVVWAFSAGYWLMLWWRHIRWTSQRIAATLLMAPAAAILAGVIGVILNTFEHNVGFGFGSMVAPLFWVVGTIFIWQETKSERAARLIQHNADAVTCPSCGYNLTGLTATRCPECGTTFTLNDLFARQPHREAAKLEAEING